MIMDAEARARVCQIARSYLGTPWRGQGRDRMGVDCVGILVVAFRGAGFTVDEGRPDYQTVDSKRLVDTLVRHFDKLHDGAPLLPADIVVYGMPRDCHVALLVDGRPLNAIHSPMNHRVVEARFDPTRGRIRGFYRWRPSSS